MITIDKKAETEILLLLENISGTKVGTSIRNFLEQHRVPSSTKTITLDLEELAALITRTHVGMWPDLPELRAKIESQPWNT